MMSESYISELLRCRWGLLCLCRFPDSVLNDYRMLKNHAKI
nr:YlcG family protein [Escherichia coli]